MSANGGIAWYHGRINRAQTGDVQGRSAPAVDLPGFRACKAGSKFTQAANMQPGSVGVAMLRRRRDAGLQIAAPRAAAPCHARPAQKPGPECLVLNFDTDPPVSTSREEPPIQPVRQRRQIHWNDSFRGFYGDAIGGDMIAILRTISARLQTPSFR